MLAYIARRTLIAIFTMAVISFLSFVIIQLPPGDLVEELISFRLDTQQLSQRPTPEEEQRMRVNLGLDKPLLLQYWDWISKIVLHADFGVGYTSGESQPIQPMIAERLPATIYLMAFTMLITWCFAISVGMYSAVR